MKKIIFIIILVFLSGCSSGNGVVEKKIDKEIDFYKEMGECTKSDSYTVEESSLCYSQLAPKIKKMEDCIQMPEYVQEICTMSVAKELKNITLCESVKNKEKCYAGVGGASGDANICGKISNEFMHDECLKLAAATNKSTEACEFIKRQDSKEYCYLGVAKASGDEGVCKKIKKDFIGGDSGDASKQSCVIEVGKATNNEDLCGVPAVDNSGFDRYEMENSECFSIIAEQTKKIKICENIKSITRREYCYSGVARAKADAKICEKINTEHIREQCYKMSPD